MEEEMVDSGGWDEFFEAWHTLLGDRMLTVNELEMELKTNEPLRLASPSNIIDLHNLHASLRIRKGTVSAAGFVLVGTAKMPNDGGIRWFVVSLAPKTDVPNPVVALPSPELLAREAAVTAKEADQAASDKVFEANVLDFNASIDEIKTKTLNERATVLEDARLKSLKIVNDAETEAKHLIESAQTVEQQPETFPEPIHEPVIGRCSNGHAFKMSYENVIDKSNRYVRPCQHTGCKSMLTFKLDDYEEPEPEKPTWPMPPLSQQRERDF